ncbi:EamA family transporter [Syntrophomonas palmitatica]|uniref:EamA family transporter n=1 Tax=Syntrophomonas palmitatica TaxID=402877 RepID=UPI001FA7ADB8|nr:EamA family transporter [Syntrophomonas palmitatica]
MAIFLLSVFIASLAQIILKRSADSRHRNFISEYLNTKVIIGYMLMGISTLGAIFAYRGIELKNGPILESIGYVFVLMLSWVFLKEQPSRYKVFGIILIITGIIVSTY